VERLIMLTGKGGVGKTSLAAAHALASARQGRRTLLASVDAAHNLSDLVACAPAPEPTEVAPYLDILEVDANRVREEDFAQITDTVAGLLMPSGTVPAGTTGATDGQAIVDVPGLDPLFFLLKVDQLAGSGRYDRIVLDLAPTGETLSLLQLPELMSWWMERIFPLGRLAVRALRPVAKGLWKVELPDAHAMNEAEALYTRLRAIQTLLKEPSVTSVRLVTQPERMIIEETKRSYMYLNLFGYAVDHVYVNGIYPADQVDEFFRSWVEHQRTHLAEIDAAFPHLPLTRVPRFSSDIVGLDDIGRLADIALDEHTFDVREDLVCETYATAEDGYELRLPIPLVDKEDIRLSQSAADLVVRIGNFQRNIPLPATLHGYDVVGARHDGGVLAVTFGRTTEEAPR
jgi:arsenite/tail-anchored protein-transporting ATPase